MSTITLETIGFIETCFKEKFGTPRQSALVPSSWGIIRLRPELNLSGALDGLEGFSHLWLIFAFHLNTNKGVNAKVHPPRMEGASIGLFATRTPHRPNPLGLSVVRLEKIAGNEIHVSGLDLVDGTPILDIKPYLPSADAVLEARAGWTGDRPLRTIEVVFSEEAERGLEKFFIEDASRARRAICEILELDPRPVFYRGTDEKPNPYTDVYGFRFDDFNVVYQMVGTKAEVQSLERWSDYLSRRPVEKK